MISPFCLERPGPFKSCSVSFEPTSSYFHHYLYEWEYLNYEDGYSQSDDYYYVICDGQNYLMNHFDKYLTFNIYHLCSIGPELPFLQGPEPPPHTPQHSIDDLMTP